MVGRYMIYHYEENDNKEYYVEYSFDNITEHDDIVEDDRRVYSLVDIVMISIHQSLLDARNGW